MAKAQALSSKQISYLRGLAHKLDPVVTVGTAGVTEGVVKELEFTLKTFELIKVKVRCEDQEALQELVANLSQSVKATKVQVIGHTAIFYRRSKEPKIAVPGLPMPEVKVEEKPIFKKSFNKVYKKSAPKREDSGKRWGRLARVKKEPATGSSSGSSERTATGRGFTRGRK